MQINDLFAVETFVSRLILLIRTYMSYLRDI